jgi:hypothetical protein
VFNLDTLAALNVGLRTGHNRLGSSPACKRGSGVRETGQGGMRASRARGGFCRALSRLGHDAVSRCPLSLNLTGKLSPTPYEALSRCPLRSQDLTSLRAHFLSAVGVTDPGIRASISCNNAALSDFRRRTGRGI